MNAPREVDGWRDYARQQVDLPPLRPRVPLLAGSRRIGSVEPGFLARLGDGCVHDGKALVEREERAGSTIAWHVGGEPTTTLARLAERLRAAHLAGPWRDEQLAVPDASGALVGTVERALVRVLGIRTHAVHLLGFAPDGRMWVQRRSLDKPNDPGLLDTLVGGMVPAAETSDSALQRESMEEAGLEIDRLQGVQHGGDATARRPSRDGGGAGYMDERIAWYRALVPEGVTPCNQDGEVSEFLLMDRAALVQAVLAGQFTAEAGLLLAEAL